ncbi:unnamed protein product [Caenorhabditis bovis]|uniref:AD domain-containing protein n=1 Tax=Caenorhabditis bovis TaxID=2654633 RepID=A0A8S1F4K9_9PELO|nr:unnamed protein product [Caenorhabditis bovis]
MISVEETYNMLGKPIKVVLDDGNKRTASTTTGNLVTIDPTSGTLVLAQFHHQCEIRCFELIPSSSISNISKLEEIDENCAPFGEAVLEQIDKLLGMQSTNVVEDGEMYKRAEKVINYLRAHHIEVFEEPNGVFRISGVVRFEKPYRRENLYCDIPMVLQRLLKLLDEMQ